MTRSGVLPRPVLACEPGRRAISRVAAPGWIEAPHTADGAPLGEPPVRRLGDGRRDARVEDHSPGAGCSAAGTNNGTRPDARRLNPAKCDPWAWIRSSCSPTSPSCSGARAGISPTTTGRHRSTRTPSSARCPSRSPAPCESASPRNSRQCRSGSWAAGRQHRWRTPRTGMESGGVDEFLYCDQEILLRHSAQGNRRQDRAVPEQDGGGCVTVLPAEFADLEQFRTGCRPTRRPVQQALGQHYGSRCRPSTTPITACAGGGHLLLGQVPARRHARRMC